MKAQGLSLNVVVVAAVALLVLVVLTVIVLNSAGNIQEGTACESQPTGQCTTANSCPAGTAFAAQYSCPVNAATGNEQLCCIAVGSVEENGGPSSALG